jgi:hypothetical protein
MARRLQGEIEYPREPDESEAFTAPLKLKRAMP